MPARTRAASRSHCGIGACRRGGARLAGRLRLRRHAHGQRIHPEPRRGRRRAACDPIPGTSSTQAVEMQEAFEQALRAVPEVAKTFAKIGTAEVATDPMPPNVADGFVMIKPRDEWPDPRKPAELVADLAAAVESVPGSNHEFTQPIEMRFNELIAGVRSDVAVKVFGDDLAVLLAKGEAIAGVLEDVAGRRTSGRAGRRAPDARDRRRSPALARLVSQDEVHQVVRTAIGGSVPARSSRAIAASTSSSGSRKRCASISKPSNASRSCCRSTRASRPGIAWRTASDAASSPSSRSAPSRSSRSKRAPIQISRENGKRRIVVSANVRGRDMGSFVAEAEQRIRDAVAIPTGY
ncbi:MAG: efflux RND transporter permease subunit [Myxococcota bacterium]